MTAPQKDEAVIERGRAALLELRDACRSLVYATFLTDDGFEVVSLPGGSRNDGRLASMASSIQALADAVAGELQIGSSEFVIIASDSGHVIQRRVPGETIVLAALFDDDETLAKALSISRVTTEKMSALSEPIASQQ